MKSGVRNVMSNKICNIVNKYRKVILMFIDTIIAIVSYLVPYVVTGYHPVKMMMFKEQFLIFTVIYIGAFLSMGVYKYMWRYAGIEEIYKCLKASAAGNFLFIIITSALNMSVRYYVYPMVFIISSFCTIGIRIVYRALIIINRRTDTTKVKTNVMIIGAGQATALLLKELGSNNPNNYSVKCILDDDKTKNGRGLHKVPVTGDTSKIVEMSERYDIELIIISIPSIDNDNKKRILDICSKTSCKLKILPEVFSLIPCENLKNIAEKIRDVQVEDLLGRIPVTLDCNLTKKYIENKTVLVTGGGGSIGSELCRQISSYFPKKLIILDIYENNVYLIQQELLREYGEGLNLEVEIASVRDRNKMENLFASKNIDIVFHAAAHKHVPLMEHNPDEAVKNNIIGTYNTVLLADKYKVEKFILISTDKAVNPTSIMGATKRVCEMIVQSFDKHSSTDFVAVRFGNVLGSNGSVVPLFMQQLKEGGPITVTHEDVTRYFMTIVEAVQLVLRAASIAKGGEIFVLDMGEPIKIKDMAFNLIRLSGLVPNEDIKVVYTGLRPGEKLQEELLISEKKEQEKTCIDKIFIEKPTEFNEVQFYKTLAELEKVVIDADVEEVIRLVENIVPTYKRTANVKISADDIS